MKLLTEEERRANTDALFAHFASEAERAAAEPDGVLRDVAIKVARDAEWHTLWAAVKVRAISDLYELTRIFARIRERVEWDRFCGFWRELGMALKYQDVAPNGGP